MAREADYYSPGEAARLLGLAEVTLLGMLTSGELEGQQDEQARWWIPAAAVHEALRRSSGANVPANPSTEETIAMPVSPGSHSTEDTTTQAEAGDTPGGKDAESTADIRTSSGWVTTKVAAEALGVDPRTVRTYISRGELEAKVEGEGVEKTYIVSIDSVYALRDRRGPSRKSRHKSREKSARVSGSAEGAEDLADMVRELTSEVIRSSAEAADLRARLELTERTESSLREDLEREREERQRHQEEAQLLRAELEAERAKGFWRRLFGG